MGAWVGPLISGLSALAGGLGQNQYPGYNDPATSGLRDAISGQYQNLMNPTNQAAFQSAYTQGGLRNMAIAGNNEGNSVNDFLASRGLGRTTAGAGTLRDVSQDVGSNVAGFLSNVPLAMSQRNLAILGQGGQFLNSMAQAPAQPTAAGAAINQGAQGLASWLGQYYANKSLNTAMGQIGSNNMYNGLPPGLS